MTFPVLKIKRTEKNRNVLNNKAILKLRLPKAAFKITETP